MARILIDTEDLRRASADMTGIAEANVDSVNRALGALRPDFTPGAAAAAAAMLAKTRVDVQLQQGRLRQEGGDLVRRAALAETGGGGGPSLETIFKRFGDVNTTVEVVRRPGHWTGRRLRNVVRMAHQQWRSAAGTGWRAGIAAGRGFRAELHRSTRAHASSLVSRAGWTGSRVWGAIKRADTAMSKPILRVGGLKVSPRGLLGVVGASFEYSKARSQGHSIREAVVLAGTDAVVNLGIGLVAGAAAGALAAAGAPLIVAGAIVGGGVLVTSALAGPYIDRFTGFVGGTVNRGVDLAGSGLRATWDATETSARAIRDRAAEVADDLRRAFPPPRPGWLPG